MRSFREHPEELYELFGPEVYSHFAVGAQPVTSVEKAGELFRPEVGRRGQVVTLGGARVGAP
jgi:hypothetical protein